MNKKRLWIYFLAAALLGIAVILGTRAVRFEAGTTQKDIEELSKTLPNMHPELPKLTPEEAHGDAVMMGGPKKGK